MPSKWLLIVGVVAAVGVALALGVSANTLLIVGAVLLCPAAMYFGMSGMHQDAGIPTSAATITTPRNRIRLMRDVRRRIVNIKGRRNSRL